VLAEFGNIAIGGAQEDVLGRASLDDPPLIYDRDFVIELDRPRRDRG
jgi:hypothetical protein